MNKSDTKLTLHDIYGTPYPFQIKTIEEGELVESTILLSPPTVKFYEVLLANYAIGINDTMSEDIDVEDAKSVLNLISKTLQMLHIAASMVDSTVTFDNIELWFRADETLIERYLQSLKPFLPGMQEKQQQKRKVVNAKPKPQRTMWTPQ